jgi:hypothetical protein
MATAEEAARIRRTDHVGLRNLSPSKVEAAMLCMMSFKFRYVDRVPEMASGVMLAGRAVHAVLESALKRMVTTGKLPSWQECDDWYRPAWDKEAAEEEGKPGFLGWNWEAEVEATVREESRAIVKVAYDQVLPTMKPKLIEHRLDWTIPCEGGDIPMVGYLDLLEEGGLLSDWKTTTKVSARATETWMQFAGYAMPLSVELGQEVINARKIFLIRGKRPRVEMAPFTIGPKHRAWFASAACELWKACRAGAYPPNTNGWWCSSKFCGFHDAVCEYGGTGGH